MCILVALMFYSTGLPVITIVANSVFSKTKISPGVGVQTLSVISLIGAIIGPFMSIFGSFKQIIVGGYLVSSVLLFFITTLFIADKD